MKCVSHLGKRRSSKSPSVPFQATFPSTAVGLLSAIPSSSSDSKSGEANADSVSAQQKLKGDLEVLFSVLPKDMQQGLLLNPQRAALFGRTRPPDHPLVHVETISSTSHG